MSERTDQDVHVLTEQDIIARPVNTLSAVSRAAVAISVAVAMVMAVSMQTASAGGGTSGGTDGVIASPQQWEAAKREWAKDKAKWADCRAQSSKQKLEGRKSWSFLYTCMTK